MTNIAKIQEILNNAKPGQFVPVLCEKKSDRLNACVVQLASNDVRGIQAQKWKTGWPETV